MMRAALLLVLVSMWAPPATAAPTAAPIVTSPDHITAALALGTQSTTTVRLTNIGSTPFQPLVYEALPSPQVTARHAQTPASARRVTLPVQTERLDPRLRTSFHTAEKTDFLVYLPDQVDLSPAYAISDWNERGRYVYETLVDHARQTQQTLRQWLDHQAIPYQPLWIVNAVLVHGGLADAQALASRADVAFVRANTTAALPQDEVISPVQCNAAQVQSTVCWNIQQVGANRVWRDFGITGRGVVVANIDTGVRFDHPALAANYRGARVDAPFDHDYNWFDPRHRALVPTDPNGHGTHTMGTMVAFGDGTLRQPAVGMAPGATWIAAQGCQDSTCTDADLIAAAQWILAPTRLDGSAPRPDLRPMIVNNSWSGNGGQDWFTGYVAAWRAAGMFPIFAAGNGNGVLAQTCGAIGSPADYPDVVAVGAVDEQKKILPYSLFGPSRNGHVKPDVVAPGAPLLSTWIGDGYDYQALQGTSMAAPHVAGLVALLWAANPSLIGNYDATYAVLRDSAQPLPDGRCNSAPVVPNNVYGYGQIDAYAAVSRVRVDVPWLRVIGPSGPVAPGGEAQLTVLLDAGKVASAGFYRARIQIFNDLTQAPSSIEVVMNVVARAPQVIASGRIRSAESGGPVQATITIDGGARIASDQDGRYTLVLSPGQHTLEVSAPAYVSLRRTINVTSSAQLPDVFLSSYQPGLTLAAPDGPISLPFAASQTISIPISNTGDITLYYHVNLPSYPLAFWRSDEPDGPPAQSIDLPSDAPHVSFAGRTATITVPLGFAFPLFGNTYDHAVVAADGVLAFGPFAAQYAPTAGCLPDVSASAPFIAPFRTSFDWSRGGQARYATVGDMFVISFENIALAAAPDATVTFQVVLMPDGRIRMLYQHVGALPAGLAVGVQHTSFESMAVGCGATTQLADGMAIEFRPQPPAYAWLDTPVQSGTLAPGQQQTIDLPVRWLFSARLEPVRALLEITSNDPFQQTVRIPIDMRPQPAPRALWVPLARAYIQQP
jgi:subtilisin family serine protease